MVQQVHDKVEVLLTEEMMEGRSNLTVQDIAECFIRPFNLGTLPLFRFKLVNRRKDVHVLLMDMHHIIFDGVSISIFVRELNELYNGNVLNELQVQYKDYAVWQKEFLQYEGIKHQEQYWLDTYHDDLPNLTLPLDYERPMIQSFEGRSIRFELGSDMTTLLREWNRSSGMTLFMTLFGAYAILLSKYTTQEDIIVGTAEAGRHHSDLEGMIGMFINTLPLRTYPSGSKTIKQFMEEVKAACIEVFRNADYQFDTLLEKLDIKREMGRNPLFDTMFILENVESLAVQMDGVTFQAYELENTTSKFDLMLVGEEIKDYIRFELKYATKLFKRENIERLRDSYVQILDGMLCDQQKKISEISYINGMERNRILYSFNNTNLDYPKEKTIAQIFEQQVKTNKEKYAVVYDGNYLTYRELDHRADCIARKLIGKGAHADSIVGIMVRRSVNMIVGILGILKAGAAYLPISEEYPESRIQFMLEDSDAIAVLTETNLRERLEFYERVVCIDEEALYQNDSNEPVGRRTRYKDLAYVIYTSGTTGRPKGVLIENRSVINLIHSLNERVYKKYEGDLNIALIAPFIFDASVKQIFASLLLGHTLHIIPEEARVDGEMLLNYYIKNRIDISDGTPIHLSILSNCRKEQLCQIPVRCFLIGGDALHNGVVTSFFEHCDLGKSSPDIVNVYGPTECCVDATTYLITSENCNKDILIGKPLSNVKVYVLDGHQAIVPIGVPGELYISGDGVARGYQNSMELTQLKFMENPFEEGMRMYRTGDLVKWTDDGSIRYLGRLDHQVKIRGFRIELGEIEEQLLKHEKMKEAVVIAREDEGKRKYLCTYFTATVNISSDELRKFLTKDLPDYMIPSYFVQLDHMPVTINGKIDRNHLPEPALLNNETDISIDLPENEVQEILVHIWCDVLGVEKVGISNNYYSLGGDSIKAIQISAKLREHNLKVAIRDLLQHQTIKEISPYVTDARNEANQDIITGEVKLTPIQKAFFENQYSHKNYYNQSIMLFRQKGFHASYIEKAFQAITKHHDALRMVFTEEFGNVTQMNRGEDSEGFHIDIFDVENVDYESFIRSKIKEIQSSINLETGPLVKVGLFNTVAGDHLLIVIHHLVIDGVSWRILLEDFHMAYTQLHEGKKISLPAKTDSYKDWAENLYQFSNSSQLEAQLSYWRTIEKQGISLLMQDAKGIGSRHRKNYETIHVCLDEEYTEKLLKETNQTYNTDINDILLTALAKSMKCCMESGKVLIHLEGHGREEIHENVDVSRTIGWFTSKYPVLLDIEHCHDVSSEIKNVKETLRRVPLKGIGYSILRYITLPMRGDLGIGLTVDPDICFNYLGQFDQDDKSDVFVSSSIDTGENSSEENDIAYAISIVGMIKQDRLFITFTYHTKEFCSEAMEVFSRSYLESIHEIIEHCLSKQEREYTPSDFDDETLSVPELDYLYELLDEIEL
ncbi:MAG TPA: amino acid adenylation domain-containing protein [Lachnospiraceae bacterium]|nr:amino acid adenylation domain-containing protein [Lachnospiraceae bacterium]